MRIVLLLIAGALASPLFEDYDDASRYGRSLFGGIFGSEASRNSTRDGDATLARTLSVIAKKTEKGRLVLLVCTTLCPRHRRQVPQWIRYFNEMQGYDHAESVAYHYYLLKHDLPFANSSDISGPTLFYLIGREAYPLIGSIANREEVVEWLKGLDQVPVIAPTSHEDLDAYLNTPNCSDRYLVYSPDTGCDIPHWRTIARLVKLKTGASTLYLHRPMTNVMGTVFYKRLPALDEKECTLLTFLQLHTYTQPFTKTGPVEVLERVRELTTMDDCVMMDDTMVRSIAPSLTELQMEFFTGERRLYAFERNSAYFIVGAISGVSVVALGISIFWGLNGSAFAASR